MDNQTPTSLERLKHISEATGQVLSFRNYAAHEYFGINLKQVYKTIREVLPEFKVLIDKIIEGY